ncbi:MAG: tetratricopeptide repeat protein [Cyanobacteria bacterium P01_G01_bin.38]
MKRIRLITLALLVSIVISLSSPINAATQSVSPLLAQQSDEASLQEAARLNEQAIELYEQGRYAEAEPLLQRALQIDEQTLGDTHPNVATSLNNLALLYRAQGNYVEAEPLLQRSLQIYEQALGDSHPDVATSLNNLALLYRAQGNYAEAEPLLQRSLQIYEQALGDSHPDVATVLNNLALLYRAQGNYAEAEPLLQHALQIDEQALGDSHPNVATSLNNLALLYRAQGNYAEAEPLLQRSLQIYEQALGETHPSVTTVLTNLALLYRDQGNYAEAEPLLQRSLQIHEQTLGDTHPNVATVLTNLALLYRDQGNYAEAEPLLQRSLQIHEQTLGDSHPDVATSLGHLAGFYHAQGYSERLLPLLSKKLSIEETNLSQVLSMGSGARKQLYANTLQGSTFSTLSFAQQTPQFTELTRLAFETILRRKGRVLDAITNSNQRLRQNLSNQDKPLFDQLQTQQSRLANLLYNPPEQAEPNQYRSEVANLKQQINDVENTLAQRSAEFRVEVEPVTIEAVQAQLPQDSTLVEMMQYQPFDFENNSWQPPRYVAYVLTPQGEVQSVDLGEAAAIDEKVAELCQALLEPHLEVKPVARELDALLMQPIRAHLGEARHLLLSPDGQLNLLPFAALVDENNQYLIETYQITHLTSGRDLLQLQLSKPSQQPAVILADPDYDQADTAVAISTAEAQSSNQRSIDASSLVFANLPGTAAEAEAIAPLLPSPTLLLEEKATENALKQVQQPSILHIATHGFFLRNLPQVPPPELDATRSFWDSSQLSPPVGSQENPLLRSGLVFAGANQRQSGQENGILTALEASGLDLRGTQLVVLSACETGLGQVANGEGVYGLRRSLVVAGTESQLMSLWVVDDIGTKDLMIDYYQRLLSGQGRSEALRQAQLAMLQSDKYQNPYYWAAFISSGNWSPLEVPEP